jgi:thiamine biosynthesis protein ThiS
MQVTVNGRPLTLPDGCTVATLLERLPADARRVAVERNQEVVPRGSYAEARIAEGDHLEVVSFVGGG